MKISKWIQPHHNFYIGIALFLFLFFGTEGTLQYLGFQPSVTDDRDLWALMRSEVTDASNQVVLMGNSRMVTDVDVKKAKKTYSDLDFIQLGILGQSPLSVLRDISEKSSFEGLAIVGLWEPDVPKTNQLNETDLSSSYINYYHTSFSRDDAVNRRISNFLQENLVSLNPFYSLKNNFQNLAFLHLPKKYYSSNDSNRSRDVDYSLIDIKKERTRRTKRVKELNNENTRMSDEEWIEQARILQYYASVIERRGGRVVFVYLPISGESKDWIRKIYPLKRYWSNLESVLDIETIYFDDYPQLRFDCPDTSHLDQRDKAAFTKSLLDIIRPYRTSHDI